MAWTNSEIFLGIYNVCNGFTVFWFRWSACNKLALSLLYTCITFLSLASKVLALLFSCTQSGSDFAQLERCSVSLGKCSEEEDSLTEKWLELAELAGDL